MIEGVTGKRLPLKQSGKDVWATIVFWARMDSPRRCAENAALRVIDRDAIAAKTPRSQPGRDPATPTRPVSLISGTRPASAKWHQNLMLGPAVGASTSASYTLKAIVRQVVGC
jgi:hypothetical protein